jgi:hypothetical protein
MAGSADKEYLRDVDPDPDLDEVASPPVAPDAASTLTPSTLTSPMATTPAARPIGSSAAPGFTDPGMTFHNATQVPVDDVWQNDLKNSASTVPNTNDLAAAQNGLLAGINAGQFSGATLGHVQAILSDIATAISTANAAVSAGSVSGADHVLRASQLSILNTVTTDPALANPAPQNEAAEPAATPEAATAPPTAPDDNPAETEETENSDAVTPDDVTAAVQALLEENPDLFSGLTRDEIDAIMQSIHLELTHINDGNASTESIGGPAASVDGVNNPAVITAQGPLSSTGQPPVNVLQDAQALPPNAAAAIDDVTIVTAEAPAIVDHSAPEPENHLHIIWG